MGITYLAANAVSSGSSSTSANLPAFERGGEGFPRAEGEWPQLQNGEQSQFPAGRPEFEERGLRGGGWMFGLFKNIGIIVIIVALMAVLKSLLRRRPVPSPVNE
jgi:hypothetical protein